MDREPTAVRGIPLEAVDANVCGDRWLLVVLPDGVRRMDLDVLLGPEAEEGLGESRVVRPTSPGREWAVRILAAEACRLAG